MSTAGSGESGESEIGSAVSRSSSTVTTKTDSASVGASSTVTKPGAASDTPCDRDTDAATAEDQEGLGGLVGDISSVASSWLSGWAKTLNTAKEKSAEVLDMVKNDIGEISNTVQNETSSLITSTSQTLRQQLSLENESSTASHITRSMSDFLSHVHHIFTPDTIDDDCVEAYTMQDGCPVRVDRLQAEITELSSSVSTFTSDPEPSDQYQIWRSEFSVEERRAELSEQLSSSSQLLSCYSQLVPQLVSHADFWHRYLFRVRLAEEREKKRQERIAAADLKKKTERINWSQEDLSEHVKVSEHQTTQLLTEYERERRGQVSHRKQGSISKLSLPDEGSHCEEDWVKEDDLDTASSNVDSSDWDKCAD